MKKEKKPRVNFTEVMEEIYHRTGVPINSVFRTLWTYNEIVKECLIDEVEIVFGDIGIFSFKEAKGKKNARFFSPGNKEFFYTDVHPHVKMIFKVKRAWRKELEEKTRKSFKEEEKEGEDKNELG